MATNLKQTPFTSSERSVVSAAERRRPFIRLGLTLTLGLTGLLLALMSLGPLGFLAKAAVSPTQDTLRDPLGWFPSGQVLWENLPYVWQRLGIGHHLTNTAVSAIGAGVVNVLVCASGGFVLAVMRPAWGRIVEILLLATLFLPGIVSLVPLYLNVINMPLFNVSLLNTFWAIWLPAGANAFNVMLVKRSMDGIPRELVEAFAIDGAGPLRILWSLAVPLTRPILGVVGLVSIVAAWKDYLWPLLVLQDPAIQPLNVALPIMSKNLELRFTMAALFIAVIIPIAIFMMFQKRFLAGVSASSGIAGN